MFVVVIILTTTYDNSLCLLALIRIAGCQNSRHPTSKTQDARHLKVGVTELEVIPGYKITIKQERSFTQSFIQIYAFVQVIQM